MRILTLPATQLFLVLGTIVKGQEFMHWNNLEGEKTEGVKTKIVWQHPFSASSSLKGKTFFSYEQSDPSGRVLALRMYSSDTSFYFYDSLGIQRTVRSKGTIKSDTKKILRYSKQGKYFTSVRRVKILTNAFMHTIPSTER